MEVRLSRTNDGACILPSAAPRPDGSPRFGIVFPQTSLKENEPATSTLIRQEAAEGGYERAVREFFDIHIGPKDLFVDVGAHWGVFSLSVASRWPGEVRVLAIEAAPSNVVWLERSVAASGYVAQVTIIPAAASDRPGLVDLVGQHGSMGHSVEGIQYRSEDYFGDLTSNLRVPTVTLDDLIAGEPPKERRRIFLKVDVEGYETRVLAGARRTLESGTVEALVIEKGQGYRQPDLARDFASMAEGLANLGFSAHVFPEGNRSGPVTPYQPEIVERNVLFVRDGFELCPNYG